MNEKKKKKGSKRCVILKDYLANLLDKKITNRATFEACRQGFVREESTLQR